jgi:hypothetical protein
LNPLFTVNLSAAALYRKVAEGPVTLLLDEADTYLGLGTSAHHEDLRGLVNAGHRRGAVAYRCVIDKGARVEEYPAFAPVSLSGIGDLPDTILDRSIVVAMKRRAPDENVEPFRRKRASLETEDLARRLARWGADAVDRLAESAPSMPHGIIDRAADVWEPLVIIGDDAGEPWSPRVRSAAVILNDRREIRDPSLGVQLLRDCRVVFGVDERLETVTLLERLCGLEESPWGDLRGMPLDARGLARRLRGYGIRPGDHKFGGSTRKGYLRSDFCDAWARYLPPDPPVAVGD